MEAVGQLTGGLAHDFNNLLTGITGSLDLMSKRLAQGRIGELERYITAAQGAANRAASLTHRLLAFSRQQTLEPKAVDANKLISGMEELVRRTVGPSIAIETVLAAGLWPCLCDPNQLENAILNLCINARDAMPEGGRITVETANAWVDQRHRARAGHGRRPVCRRLRVRQRTRNAARRSRAGLRSFLHDQADRQGHGARPVDDLRLRQAVRRTGAASTRSSGRERRSRSICRGIMARPSRTLEIVLRKPLRRVPAAARRSSSSMTNPRFACWSPTPSANSATRRSKRAMRLRALKVLESDAEIDLLITDVGLAGRHERQADGGYRRGPSARS